MSLQVPGGLNKPLNRKCDILVSIFCFQMQLVPLQLGYSRAFPEAARPAVGLYKFNPVVP
jgi:hypothetical protein